MLKVMRMGAAILGALALMPALETSAADIYSGGGYKDQPVYIAAPLWEGFYIGGHIGGDWTSNNQNDRFINNFLLPVPTTPAATFVTTGRDRNHSDVFGGAQLGYNWQNFGIFGPNFVAGIEADIGGFGANNNRTFIATNSAVTSVAIVHGGDNGGGFYGDITGRLGYAWGNALLYAKGGFAWLNRDNGNFTETVVAGTPPIATTFRNNNNNNDGTATGWTLGGGLEYALNTNWTVKVEYLHFDFGNEDRLCCFDNVNNFRIRENQTFDTVKLGVNYIFHPAVAALPYK